MNKIFKVIWNEARNAYVVVSEIAKNHGSKSCSTKKLLAMLIATGVMTCAGMAPAMAQPVAVKTNDFQYVALKAAAFAEGEPTTWNRDSWNKDFTSLKDAKQKVTAGSYAGVSHGGGTEVVGSWNYIINDSSWENSDAEYKDGYVDLIDNNMPKGFTTTDSGLNWDEVKQTYTYKGKAVDYRNMYVIDGKLGVFTNYDGSEVYTGTVYGKNNEILMTVKDNGKFYSYWAASVTDPSATMETYPVSKYNSDLAVIDKNIKDLNKDIIKEVTLTKDTNSAIIKLVRNGGNAVDGAITVTSGGGTGGSGADNDTFVKISNGTDMEGKTFATGSKVEAIVDKGATTGITINGEAYTIKSGSVVNVAQTTDKKTTTITVDGKATVITDTDTKYTKGNGIAIDKANAISVKLNKDEKNLVVDGSGLALNTALTGIQSITGAGEGKISFEGATVKVNQNTFNKDGRIQNVAKGTENTDAVNFGQLKETVAAGDTDVHIKAGNYTVDKDNKVSMNLVDKAGKSQGTVTITGVAKAEDVAVVYDKNKTSLRSTNATLQTSSGKEEAVDSIALGNGASAVKGSVAIGNGASVVEGSNGLGGVALGYKAHAGYKGTSLGSNAISGREGTTLVGANTNSGSLYTTVVGTDSVINSDGTEYNAIITSINVQGATATVVGSKNTVDNKNGKVYSGVANNVMGSANTIEGSNGVTIQGTGNKVTDAYKDMGITLEEAYSIYKGNYSALAKKQSGAIAVVGGANTVSKQTDSTVIGYDNQLIGDEKNGSHDVFMAGSHNKLTNVSDSIVMGNKNEITGVSNVISFGHQNTISADADNAVAIGNGAGVSVEGGVALGVGSVASTVAGALGYGAAEGETSIAWNATHGAVSVGSSVEGKEITRQITNVAAGTEDTDAVNVAQLKKVSEAAANANKGWNLSTNGDEASTKVAPGETVDFSGDKNISVSHDGTNVKVELNDELKDIKSIIGAGEGAGSISFADGGIKLNNKVTINKDGKITGVAAGAITETSTDAVNGSQLHAVATEAGKHTTLSNGKNTTVESTVKDGQTDYKVNVAGDLTDITSVANGDSKINLNKDSIIISNGNKYFAITNSGIGMSYIGADYSAKSIMLGENGTTISGGLNVAGSKITGVAAGEVSSTSTDAVNGSQLHAVKTELQTSDKHLVGNPASADGYYKPDANGDISLRVEDQNKNGYDVVIKDVASKAELGDVANRVTNVENKVTQIETDVTTIKTDITTIKTDINNINTRVDNVEALAGKHTTLEKNGTNINVEETVVDGQKNYKVNLNKDITLGDENGNNVSISGTNGTITATGDITTANRINAANGGKLADIDVTGNKLSNGNSSITLDGTNVKVNDKVTVDKDGKISGVAKGDISNTSTDAVNGSQLYDTNTHITNVENQVISNSNRINQLGNRVNKVGAGAAALAALHPMDFDPDDKLTFSAGYGNYGGENAAAIGAYYRPDEKVMFSVGGTVGNGENMVNAGVSFALDRTNHVSNSRTALAREVIDLRGQLAVMGAKMAKMEKAFGMLDETKTKLFPDVPANHWAYEYIAKLAGNGYIEGYPDGNFGGDRLMTRYEFAAMLYRAIEKGAALEEKIIKEFEPELGRIRVDRISGEDGDRDKIERVRVNDTKGERDHYGNKLAK